MRRALSILWRLVAFAPAAGLAVAAAGNLWYGKVADGVVALLIGAVLAYLATGWTGLRGSRGDSVLRGADVLDADQARRALRRRTGKRPRAEVIHLGGVPVAPAVECEHFLIAGKTGSGKTQAIQEILRVAAARNEKAIIADSGGGFLSRFYRAGAIILNPLDQRSAAWSPFAEIRQAYDCDRIARSAIPDAEGSGREWNFYAQTLLAQVLKAQHAAGRYSMRELLRLVSAADADELAEVLDGTPAAILTAAGNEKMLSNTRAIIAVYLAAWHYLPDRGDFSIRDWVKDDNRREWVYLTYRDDQLALLRSLVACWMDLAIVEGLSLDESRDRRLWYVLDELDSLDKVQTLDAGLTKLRKYGGAAVCGLQTVAQVRATYGRDLAQTLLSCMSNKLILAAGDAETARYFEQEIGQQEVLVEQRSVSTSSAGMFGAGSGSASRSRSYQQRQQAAVLASELQGLPNLSGLFRQTGEPWAWVSLAYRDMPAIVPAFEAAR